MSGYVLNKAASRARGLFRPEEYASVADFFLAMPGYSSSPLHRLPSLAEPLGLGEVLVKDETSRLGLNSFKILGVSYAVHRLQAEGRLASGTILACATDGNHGRAVAHVAARLNLESRVYMPRSATPARIEGIAREGAEVTVVEGTYDDAVRQLARDASERKWLVVSDTSWPGYEEIPRWIVAGYTQMLNEASRQWQSVPDVVLVQAGVGGLACAVASWFADQLRERRPYLIVCEPESAACLLEAARIGRPVQIPGDLQTIMECLSAGQVSHIAWPVLARTIDCFITVEDAHAVDAVQLLKREPPFLTAGESGAAGLAGLSAIRNSPSLAPVWQAVNLGPRSRVMVLLTEGPAI